MQKDSIKNIYLSKIIICFGLVTLLTSMVDIASIFMFPNFGNVQWINTSIQQLAELSMTPALGVLFILIGINLYNNLKVSKLWLNIEKAFSILNFFFVLSLSLIIVVYFITISPIQHNNIAMINKQADTIKSNIIQVYNNNKAIIPKERLNESLDKVNKTTLLQVKLTKSILLKKDIKTLINLILFTIIYLIMGIIGFKTSNLKNNTKENSFGIFSK